MKIKKATTEDKRELYFLTSAPTIGKISEHKGEQIGVAGYAFYVDEQLNTETGEMQEVEILSIKTPEGEVFATNSATFIREFDKIVSMFGNNFEISIIEGTSKKGRKFVSCVLA